MISAIGKRPWSIHGFAILFLGVGLWALIGGLGNIDGWLDQYREIAPQLPWDREWVIVALSARFSIVCIPVIAIWIYKGVVARVLVSVFTLIPLMGIIRLLGEGLDALGWEGAIGGALLVLGCALLYTPSARMWFEPKAKVAQEVFE